MMNRTASLVIVSGPSGCGKDTVLKDVLKQVGGIGKTISCTTRAPRYDQKEKKWEQHGVDYFFISREEFEEKIRQNGFLEYANNGGDWYGTPLDYVEKLQNEGNDLIILNIEDAGAAQIKAYDPTAVSIFILPPNAKEVRRRLANRDSESVEKQNKRYHMGQEQMKRAYVYDYVVMNDKVENAAKEIIHILSAVRCRTMLHKKLIDQINTTYLED